MELQKRFKTYGICEMTRIDPARNRYRYYCIAIQPGLFEVAVQRRWGRVGRQPRGKNTFFQELQDAVHFANRLYRTKTRRGYLELSIPGKG